MPNEPHFDERTSQSITLKDGRTLGFAEYGPKDGRPVFHLHGLPGSRFEGKLFEKAAITHNARIITIDRPGVGSSSPKLGRTATDHAEDVRALARHLQLDTYVLMAVSGGGPYGFACAYAIPPSELTKVAIVAGCSTWKSETAEGMMSSNQWMFWGLKVFPWATYPYIYHVFAPMLRKCDEAEKAMVQDESEAAVAMSEKDADALEDEEITKILEKEIKEHFKQGYGTYVIDGRIICGELDLDIPAERCGQVSLWYGKQDVNVPPAIGEDYLKRLKNKARLRIEDESHIGLVKNWRSEILADLLA